MKKRKILYNVLMFVPIILNIFILPYLPKMIPTHYGVNNLVDRWGSKYEILIFPIIIIIFGYVMIKVVKKASKSEISEKNNQKLSEICTIIALLIFNVINIYFLYTAYKGITNLNIEKVDFNKFLFMCIGVGFIIIGNLIPKSRRNTIYGLRTPWSIKDDETWNKNQLFGGISFMITGVVLIISCMIYEGLLLFVICIVILFITLLVDIFGSYFISKKENRHG